MTVLRFGPFELDTANATFAREGRRVDLTPKAFDLLALLASRAGQLVSKEQILDEVWGRRFVSESVVKTVVSGLRAALDDDARSPRWLETVSRRGYRLVGQVVGDAAAPAVPASAAGSAGMAAPALSAANGTPPVQALVGRMAVLDALYATWCGAVTEGRQRIVFVAGEPGMGKSTLIDALAGRVLRAGAADTPLWAVGQCVEHHGAAEPYLPALEALDALVRQDAAVLPLVRRIAPTWLLQLPWHQADGEREALVREVSGSSQERMLREMGMLLEQLCATRPLLMVLEDLHWADGATVALLNHLARRRGRSRLLVLASFRPAEVIAQEHPLLDLRRELLVHRLCDEFHLEGFDHAEVAAFIAMRLDVASAEPAFVAALAEHTGGLPLFLSGVLDELVEQQLITRDDGHGRWQLPRQIARQLPLPHNLLALVDRQLERLPAPSCRVLEAAALLGTQFDARCVALALDLPSHDVRDLLDDLVRRRRWLREGDRPLASSAASAVDAGGASYAFSHALVRHAFAGRPGTATRIELHRRLGAALEAVHGDAASGIAGELALHAERGEEPLRAAGWLAAAAAQAMQRIAPHEALELVDRGLAWVARCPDGSAAAIELQLLALRLGALAVTEGYSTPRAASSVERALQLVTSAPPTAANAPLWHALWWALINGGQWHRGAQLARQFEQHAADGVPIVRAAATNIEAMSLLFADRFEAAIERLKASLGWYRQSDRAASHAGFVQDLEVEALSHLVLALTACARDDEARTATAELEARLDAGADPLSEAMGLWYLASAAQLRRDTATMRRLGEQALEMMSQRSALPGAGPHHISLGWALTMSGEPERGLELIARGRAHYAAQGSVIGLPWFRACEAEAQLAAGDVPAARRIVDEGRCLAEQTDLAFMEVYLQRVHGEVLRAEGRHARAASVLQEAVDAAQRIGAERLRALAEQPLAALRLARKPDLERTST